eukprot:2504034-Amphidinium_carterae.1
MCGEGRHVNKNKRLVSSWKYRPSAWAGESLVKHGSSVLEKLERAKAELASRIASPSVSVTNYERMHTRFLELRNLVAESLEPLTWPLLESVPMPHSIKSSHDLMDADEISVAQLVCKIDLKQSKGESCMPGFCKHCQPWKTGNGALRLSLIHISEPTRPRLI